MAQQRKKGKKTGTSGKYGPRYGRKLRKTKRGRVPVFERREYSGNKNKNYFKHF